MLGENTNRSELRKNDPIAQFELRIMLIMMTDRNYFESIVKNLTTNIFDFQPFNKMLMYMLDDYQKNNHFMNFYDVFDAYKLHIENVAEEMYYKELYELMRYMEMDDDEIEKTKNDFRPYIKFQCIKSSFITLGELVQHTKRDTIPNTDYMCSVIERVYQKMRSAREC